MILMFCFSFGVLAADPWDGSVDTDWYTNASSDTTDFEIDTPAELAGLALLVTNGNNFTGKTVTLMADLDLGGVYADGTWDNSQSKEFAPIGVRPLNGATMNTVFCGTFDGNNKTISNFYLKTIAVYRGLFAYIGPTGCVMNLTIDSGSVSGGERTGAIAGYNDGVILNCNNNASVITPINGNTGGIVGYNYSGSIVNCMNSGAISTGSFSIGGIAGYNAGSIVSCYNCGVITSANNRVGGVVGENQSPGAIRSCYNTGNVSTSLVSTNVMIGGIVGLSSNGSVKNCYNTGTVSGQPMTTGAILGSNVNSTLSNLFYLKTDTINNNLYSVGAATAPKADAANTYANTADQLKSNDTLLALGTFFAADTENRNNGYPVLSWQVNGYPEAETNGLAIDNITATNGIITITMNKSLSYTKLGLTDFTITATSNGNAITLPSMTLTQVNGDSATVATIAYTAIEASSVAQSIDISVAYNNGEEKTADFDIAVSNEWSAFAADGFEGGSGTLADPYQVKTPAQLAFLSAQVKAGNNFSGSYIEQTADIDLGSSVDEIGSLVGLNWTAIGPSSNSSFNGNYNGHGFKITHLVRVTTGASFVGLFGYTTNARIINVNLENPIFNVGGSGGCLIGYATDTTVKNCHVNGGSFITTNNTGGGLIGSIKSTATSNMASMEIASCSCSASVRANTAGGLIAYIAYGSITNGQPTTIGYVDIEDCYATGDVCSNAKTNTGYIGGLVGQIQIINHVSINHCYASGSLTSKDKNNVGGLVAFALVSGSTRVSDAKITNSAAMNRNLTYTGTGTASNYARIMGNGKAAVSSGYVTLKNNKALDVSMINGTMVDSSEGGSADGASVTKEDFAVQSNWENSGFDFTDTGAWLWNSPTNLPDLRGTLVDYAIQFVSHPHDAVAYIDKDAIFQIKAKNGVGTFTYQWQYSQNGTTWNDVTDATDTVLTIPYDTILNGYQYRCVVTDEAGQTANSNAATLSVKSKKYTADIAAANLYKVYQRKGTLNTVREPISLYAYQQDTSDFTGNLRYYGNYYVSGTATSQKPKGNLSWAMLDHIAAGGNPRQYVKQGDNTAVTDTDLVAEILGSQSDSGAFITTTDIYGNDTIFDNIIYTLSMDIYFDGAKAWGNEKDGTSCGRDGALDYLFSQLQDDSASDGQYFYTLTPFNIISTADAQRSQADFVILMSRLVDDDTYGNQAEKAMYNVMELLNYFYDNGQITSTETMGRYLSALIAAANATDNHLKQNTYYDQADDVYASLQTAWALDGTYAAKMNYSTPLATGDANATAAVIMGLSDYVNDNCSLATMCFCISDEDVLNSDFADISVPSTTTSDLVLPTSGTYGTIFTWESSVPKAIAADGTVTRQAKEQTVTLTVTGKYGTAESTKTFTVTVPAAQSADGDAVDAVMKTLDIPPETISDLTLPTSGDDDVTISWATSKGDVITDTGAVTRPADGGNDVTVILTATVSKNDATKTKDFEVLVRANTSDTVKEAYYETRSYYFTHKKLTGNYWQAFAAYAALGDYIQDPDNGYTFYDVTQHKLGQTWQGTDYGAVLLEIMAIGENPYNYNGVNYVDLAVKNGTDGPYACPIWATMGLESAGAQGYSPAVGYCVGQLSESAMTYGVDIAGWAVAELSRHLGEPGVDEAIANFTALMKSHQSEKAYFNYHSMGSIMISTGCVVTGFTALTAAGVDGYDVTKDPWLVNGVNMIDSMYNESKSDTSIGNFSTQMQIEFCDLYNTFYNNDGLAWFSMGVSKDKLDDQITKANVIMANADDYTSGSVTVLQSALDEVNGISSERLEADIPNYGKEYYDLYDAVRYAQTIDESVNNQTAVDEVTALIEALPDADAVTLTDQDAAEAARTAYDRLTDDQKALVAEDTLTRLIDIEAALNDLITLSDAKTAAKDALSTALAGYGEDDYTSENWTLLNQAKTDGDTAIDHATTVDDVTTAKDSALAAMAAVETRGNDNVFTDVNDDDWFYDDVNYVVENEIFKGTSTTSFSPDATMTRGMLVTVLFRLSGDDAVSGVNAFSDVKTDAYYADAVVWAADKGITTGTGNNHFSPSQVVTREEAVTFLYRFAKYIEANLTETTETEITSYSDYSEISSWALESLTWAYNAQIIQGVSDNRLNPAGETTRAQMAAIIHRFMKKLEK